MNTKRVGTAPALSVHGGQGRIVFQRSANCTFTPPPTPPPNSGSGRPDSTSPTQTRESGGGGGWGWGFFFRSAGQVMNTEKKGQRLRCPFTADKAGAYFRIGKLHIHPAAPFSLNPGRGRGWDQTGTFFLTRHMSPFYSQTSNRINSPSLKSEEIRDIDRQMDVCTMVDKVNLKDLLHTYSKMRRLKTWAQTC